MNLIGCNVVRLLASSLLVLALAVPARAAGPDGIAWVPGASVADVERAFEQARSTGRPLFLYWGAQWCPPCNQVKATVFNRADFVAHSRNFVAVPLDGDSPSAQKLAARFKVRGYPTMILFTPQGRELTRLPGEVDAPLYLQALAAALAGGRPVADLLAAVQRGEPLDAAQWRQLAWYAWDTDEQSLLPEAQRPRVLLQLARAAGQAQAGSPAGHPQAAIRLQLKAVLAAADSKDTTALDDDARFAAGAALLRLLGDGSSAREQMDLVTNYAKELVGALSQPGTPQRVQLVAAWDQAARRLQADTTLSRTDRLGALYARVALARLDEADDAPAAPGVVPAALQAEVQALVQAFGREVTAGYELQTVIPTAADVLKRAGLVAQSDALLKANLARSPAPYYLMSQLAGNAKARGDKAEALQWYQRAWETSKGPATRVQWGASYVTALVDLAPDQAARIEKTAATVLGELAATPDAFYERNARSVQRIGKKLMAWNAQGKYQAPLQRLARRLAPVCAQLPAGDAQRSACDGVFAKAS
ncbi:MAG TPA: thioredoxin family protein [Burkholderiaceae bacterium]|nr:thioredoxin family protein [Burkholderiaceae bacterium]